MRDDSALTADQVGIARRVACSMLGTTHAQSAIIEPVAPGLSGAAVFRLTDASGRSYAIKRWPHSTSKNRIREVHHVMTTAVREGCDLVPNLISNSETQGTWFCDRHGMYWELCDWRSGIPFVSGSETTEPKRSALAYVRAGGEAIARFHQSVKSIDAHCTPAPAILARIERWRSLDKVLPAILRGGGWAQFSEKYADSPELVQVANESRGWLTQHWQPMMVSCMRDLETWCTLPVDLQTVMRDVHREHVLFDINPSKISTIPSDGVITHGSPNPTVVGLIDFDAVRIDTPATDVARWAASFTDAITDGMSAAELIDVAAAGYRDVQSFTEQQGLLAETIANSSSWITLANWIVWLVGEQRDFPGGPNSVFQRMKGALIQTRSAGPS